MLTPADHRRYLEAAVESAKAAPLSRRKAMLAVMLADAYADHLFAAGGHGSDILAFREALARRSPALGIVFALAAANADGPRLVTEAVEVPLADYGKLDVADFMVSLYNNHTVQRVRIAMPDGSRLLVHDVLAEAIAALMGSAAVEG